jgi:hypothetical protein
MDGQIRKYVPDDCVAIAQFMEKHFPRTNNGIVKRSRSALYYRWKYGPNPFGESIMYTYWEGLELSGIFGAVPEPLAIRGKRILAYQVVDAFVAPEMQGKGIFRKMADAVFDEIDRVSELSFAMSPSNFSLPIFIKKYGMYVGPTYRQVFSPIRFDEILRAKQLRFIAAMGSLANIICNKLLRGAPIEIEEINRIDCACNPTPMGDADYSIIKDQEYIRFRYTLCPESYRFFRIGSSNRPVVLIVKFVKWRDMTICYLIDVIGDLGRENRPLFLSKALYTIGLRTESAVVSAELHNPRKELSRLKYLGFICHNREECLTIRQNHWAFLKPSSGDYDSRRWIIFSGDSDYI